MAGSLKEKHPDNRKLFVRRWMLLTPTWEATKERTNCERNNLKLKWAVIGTTGWDGEGSFCSSLTHDPAPCHRPVKARRLAQQWVRRSVSQLHSFCCRMTTTPHAPLTRQRSGLTSLQESRLRHRRPSWKPVWNPGRSSFYSVGLKIIHNLTPPRV